MCKGSLPSKMKTWIEVITGCMFAGKTSALIDAVERMREQEDLTVLVLAPAIDRRFLAQGESFKIVSHDNGYMDAVAIGETIDELPSFDGYDAIAVDEAQFLSEEVLNHLIQLPNMRVLTFAGLTLDWRGEPFGVMPRLLCHARSIDWVYTRCVDCKQEWAACRTRKVDCELAEEQSIVEIGGAEKYAPVCRECHAKWLNKIQATTK